MITYTNKELTAQVQDLKEQLAKALAEVAKNQVAKIVPEHVEYIYKCYPRKVAPAAAKKAINKALSKISARELYKKVLQYREATRWLYEKDKTLIPHPATWFNGERWMDDPKEWDQPTQGKQGPDPTKSILG